MNEVVTFLQENPVQYLATVGRDGKAKCRPFMFAGEKDGKLWFCTNNQKDVYKDMQANPNIELSVSSPAYAWIRLSGEAVFENNMAAKEMCIQNPIVKGQYAEASNPIFEVFYLKNAHAVIADFSGNPPKVSPVTWKKPCGPPACRAVPVLRGKMQDEYSGNLCFYRKPNPHGRVCCRGR